MDDGVYLDASTRANTCYCFCDRVAGLCYHGFTRLPLWCPYAGELVIASAVPPSTHNTAMSLSLPLPTVSSAVLFKHGLSRLMAALEWNPPPWLKLLVLSAFVANLKVFPLAWHVRAARPTAHAPLSSRPAHF